MSQTVILFLLFIWLLILIYVNLKYRNNLGKYFNLIDKPDKIRKIHKNDVPLIGSFPLVIIFFSYLIVCESTNLILFKILFISFMFFLIGIIDDRNQISYLKKSIFSVIILIIFLSLNKELLISSVKFNSFDINYPLIESHSLILTITCIIILINTFNFTDGINGLSSMIAIIWLLSITLLAKDINYYLIFFSIFILLNAVPIFFGRYFLGDSGTLFVGTFISLETIKIFNFQNANISYENIFLIFMIPGLDMIRLVFARIINNKNPFLPDRNHLHHYFIKKYSLSKTLLIYFLLITIPVFLDKIILIDTIYIICFGITVYTLIYFKIKKV